MVNSVVDENCGLSLRLFRRLWRLDKSPKSPIVELLIQSYDCQGEV